MLINTPLQVLTAAPALHSLTIGGRDDVADILEFLNNIHRDLRELIIEHCSFDEDSTGLLANIVALYPDLEGLSLGVTFGLKPDDYCLIAQLKKLSELHLLVYKVDYIYMFNLTYSNVLLAKEVIGKRYTGTKIVYTSAIAALK